MTATIVVRRPTAEDAGRRDVEPPEMPGAGLGDIDRLLVRRQAHAIRKDHRLHEFGNEIVEK